MLGKLITYEIKATARQFLPLYGALVMLSIIMRTFFNFSSFSNVSDDFSALPIVLSMMLYFALIVAIAVITLVVMLQRFYKNLLSDEGYLMFTLPVRTWELITSKLLTTMLWSFASGAVMVLTIGILAFNTGMIPLIAEGFREVFLMTGFFENMSIALFVAELIVSAIVSSVNSILAVYAAISLGHLFNSHRILASFGAYLAINMAMSTVSSVASLIFSGVSGLAIDMLNSPAAYFDYIHFAMIPSIIITIAISAALFFVTNHILSKKLNLE